MPNPLGTLMDSAPLTVQGNRCLDRFRIWRAFRVVGSAARGVQVGMSWVLAGPGTQDSQGQALQARQWPEALD